MVAWLSRLRYRPVSVALHYNHFTFDGRTGRTDGLSLPAFRPSGAGGVVPGVYIEMDPRCLRRKEPAHEQRSNDRTGEWFRRDVVEVGHRAVKPGIVSIPQRKPPH